MPTVKALFRWLKEKLTQVDPLFDQVSGFGHLLFLIRFCDATRRSIEPFRAFEIAREDRRWSKGDRIGPHA
jgi:hypothetical protein